ncbi:MAG: hypothetical protein CMF63_04120 [Magnetovibrio sp.]|jgi:hypothetical protein|nr:hypothetical protein [Magnetovibrio sp.]MAE44164.1 hypothetical protein [Magnetovibrio sp.]|tara:strand:- start:401 stop:814 length:414 start_codon:yes stop_codon:yes gene_type:complete
MNIFKMNSLPIIFIVFLIFIFSGCRTKNLISPVTFPIPSSLQNESIAKAIKEAAINRKWFPYEEKEGVIYLSLEVRTHIVKVDIEYGDGQIKIVYRDSENMLYEEKDDGTILIHKKYNDWIKNLRIDIQLNLVSIDQ